MKYNCVTYSHGSVLESFSEPFKVKPSLDDRFLKKDLSTFRSGQRMWCPNFYNYWLYDTMEYNGQNNKLLEVLDYRDILMMISWTRGNVTNIG